MKVVVSELDTSLITAGGRMSGKRRLVRIEMFVLIVLMVRTQLMKYNRMRRNCFPNKDIKMSKDLDI